MAPSVSGFKSNTVLHDGHPGLLRPKGSKSNVTITGSGFTNGLPVDILEPPNSHSPKHHWTGALANVDAGGTTGTSDVTQQQATHHHTSKDDATTVSVSVGGSPTTNANTHTNDS